MPKRDITFDTELDVGITPSLRNSDVKFWRDGSNVAFVGGAIRPMFSQFDIATPPSARPLRGSLLETRIEGTPYAFLGDQRALFRFDGNTVVDVTRAAGGAYNGITNPTLTELATAWSMTPWGNWVFATQEKDVPQVYKPGPAKFADLDTENGVAGDTFSYASIMVSYRTFLIAMNTVQLVANGNGGADFIHWCSSDDPGTWAPTINNSAGSLQARDAGPILAACSFRGNIAFATGNSLHMLRFVGAPNWFGQEKLIDGIGVLGKQSMISVGGVLYGIGTSGFWISDGSEVKQIDEPMIHDYIMETMCFTHGCKVMLWYNKEEDSVEIHYRTLDSQTFEPNHVIAYRLSNRTFTLSDRARVAASDGSVFGRSLTATATGRLLQQTRSADDSGNEPRPGPVAAIEAATVASGYGDGGYGNSGYGGIQEIGEYENVYVAKTAFPGGFSHDGTDLLEDLVFGVEFRFEPRNMQGTIDILLTSIYLTNAVGLRISDVGILSIMNKGVFLTHPTPLVAGTWYRVNFRLEWAAVKATLYLNGEKLFETIPSVQPDLTSINIGTGRGLELRNYVAINSSRVSDQDLLDDDAYYALINTLFLQSHEDLQVYVPFDFSLVDYGHLHKTLTVISGYNFVHYRTEESEDARISGRSTSDALVVVIRSGTDGSSTKYAVGGEDVRKLFLESKFLDGDNPRITKFLYLIISEVTDRASSLKLKILYKNTLEEVAQEYEVALGVPTIKVRVPGAKYIALRIEDISVKQIWRLTRLYADAMFGGGRAV